MLTREKDKNARESSRPGPRAAGTPELIRLSCPGGCGKNRAVESSGRASARASILHALALVAGLTTGLGCSTSHFDGHVYRHEDIAFRLARVPEGWRAIESSDTALAFRDDSREATIAINGRCGKDAEDVPLRSLTQHLFIQFTERRLERQELLSLDGREALATRMVAKLDGVPKHFQVVVLKKDGCVYDFWQITAREVAPETFLDFVQGFSTLS
jgi:hypothetical protein